MLRLLKMAGAALSLAALTFSVLPGRAVARTGTSWQPPGAGTPGYPWFPPGGSDPGSPGYPWFPPGSSTPGQPPGNGGRYADGFPAGFEVPVSDMTGRPVGGWGCDSSGRTDGGTVERVPVLFVHGNTRDAHDWDQVRQYYLAHGYTPCETWALSYGNGSQQRLDTNDPGAATVQAFVENMIAWLQEHKNSQVTQVDIVSHSMGGTVVRKWLKNTGAYNRVRSFVAIAAPNHGLGGCRPTDPGVCREIAPGSRWLADLNAGDETPEEIRYMTVYDGTGRYDLFYPSYLKDSPALQGAVNRPYNVEHGTRLDHLALINQTAALQLQWLQDGAGK